MMHARGSRLLVRQVAQVALRPVAGRRVAISIEDLLHWAFARECAQLDFGGASGGAAGYGYVSSTAAIIRHEQLGCHVDGGGRSDPHHDADVVAAAVAALPAGHGGRGMAVAIAEHARAGTRPDAMVGAVPRCVPVAWANPRGVRVGKAEVIDRQEYVLSGRKRAFDVVVVPVTWRPDQSQIAAARRGYLSWWGAVLEIRQSFQTYGGLSCWDVTDDMPVMKPWLEKSV